MERGDPLMALTGDLSFSGVETYDEKEEEEEDVDREVFTRPLKEAVEFAFLKALGSLGFGVDNEQLRREVSHDDLASVYSEDELGNLTLKETVEMGFKNTLRVLTGMNLSQENISDLNQEMERIENELFQQRDLLDCPLSEGVAAACNNCVSAAQKMLDFITDLRKSKKVSIMKMIDALRPQELQEAERKCEAIKATVEAVRSEVAGLLELCKEDSNVLGRSFVDPPTRICNGYDSVLQILLQLVNGIVETIQIILGLQNKYLDVIWWANYNSQLSQHLAQLRRVYGIIFTCARMSKLVDPSKTMFVAEDVDELDPDVLKSIIKTDELFGRYFGFHYPLEIRNLLQVVNIARESTSSAVAASPGARNFAFLGYFILYGNMVALNRIGLDIKKASSMGSDTKGVESIENARLYLNLIDDPLIVAGSKFATPDPAIDKGFVIESHGLEPISLRLISFESRPVHVQSDMHPDNWMGRKVSSLLTKDTKKDLELLTQKLDVYMNPGARTLAKALLIHFHGGGFIGQSSKSHASYVRLWASNLSDTVILSIDYKLAPESQYPYAVNECFAAYKWALENCSSLGTLAETIAFCGDSAGGNIATAVAMKCIQEGVRVPNGLVLAYPALNLTMRWAPSRILALFDPMLPYTLLTLCLNAYIPDGANAAEDYLLSPVAAPVDILKKLPKVSVFSGAFDPLLDDSVEFVSILRKAGRDDAKLRIYDGMPHGFLGMVPVIDNAMEAAKDMSRRLAEYLDIDFEDLVEKRANGTL